jgi:hypothetical protein
MRILLLTEAENQEACTKVHKGDLFDWDFIRNFHPILLLEQVERDEKDSIVPRLCLDPIVRRVNCGVIDIDETWNGRTRIGVDQSCLPAEVTTFCNTELWNILLKSSRSAGDRTGVKLIMTYRRRGAKEADRMSEREMMNDEERWLDNFKVKSLYM